MSPMCLMPFLSVFRSERESATRLRAVHTKKSDLVPFVLATAGK